MMRFLMSGLVLVSLLAGANAAVPVAAARAAKNAKASTAKAQYECKMDGVMSTKAGKCPKCGMAMTNMGPKKAATAKYHCKMDGMMSTKAGKCPKCGMAMMKKGGASARPMK